MILGLTCKRVKEFLDNILNTSHPRHLLQYETEEDVVIGPSVIQILILKTNVNHEFCWAYSSFLKTPK